MSDFVNQLHNVDDLEALRSKVPDEDAIGPILTRLSYWYGLTICFSRGEGSARHAQITAFEETWSWKPMEYGEFLDDSGISRFGS